MKALAISLLVLVLAFLGNVVAVFISPEYRGKLQETVGGRAKEVSKVDSSEYKDDVAKLQDTIEQLTIGLESISLTGGTVGQTPLQASGSVQVSQSGSNQTVTLQPSSSGASVKAPPAKVEPKEYPLSIALQAKLMPDVFVKKVENKGIFDIKIYSNLEYTTYRDEKNKMNIYAFADSYSVILANLKLASNVYTVKETDTFFEASFFLNPSNQKDTTIRFVASLDGKAYGFELPKVFYSRLKKLLTNK